MIKEVESSGFSSAAGLNCSQSSRSRNVAVLYQLALDCGIGLAHLSLSKANRDIPGNRGRRPLPPTINFDLRVLNLPAVTPGVPMYDKFYPNAANCEKLSSADIAALISHSLKSASPVKCAAYFSGV
jgi:hypothetical protein